MDKDTILTLLCIMQIELVVFIVFAVALLLGLKTKISHYWQGRVLLSLLAIIAITFSAITYGLYSNGMVK